jgi:prephenate dehydrogenase
MSFRRISILGLGLIGGSFALACKKYLSGCHITGCDSNSKTLQEAMDGGAVDAIASNFRLACEGADCVILCVPLGVMDQSLEQIAPNLKPGVCVTDVSSVKQRIVDRAGRLLPTGVHFVGAHPMAGAELSGFAAARADLFDRALCLTTPVPQTDAQALLDVESLWRALGAKIARLSPQEHDQLVAQISHLPHLLASALVNSVTDPAMNVAGPGFRDFSRIAASDSGLWRDILLGNSNEVRQSLEKLRAELDRADAMLERGDADQLRAWLDAAAARRRSMGKSIQ